MKGFYNSIRLKREIIKFFYQNTRLIFMALSLVVGVLMGTLALKNGWFCDPSQQASSFSRFFSSRSGMTTFQIFLNSFASSLVYLLISFSCGLFLFGKPVSYVLPFIRGIGIGTVCSSAYSVMGISGLAFCSLIVLPGNFISAAAFLFSCVNTCRFSGELFKDCFTGREDGFKHRFKKFCYGYIKYISITVIGSLTDCVTASLFIGAFSV